MGNSVKYNQIGGMHIQLEKVTFHESDFINGTINFSLNQEMPPCHLEFQFKGTERSQWEQQNGKYRTRYTGKYYITKSRYNIKEWDYPLPAGGYSIPFSFQLPSTLPSSFQFHHGSTRGFIIYKLSTKLLSGKIGLKNKQKIYVFQDTTRIMYSENIPRTGFIHTWCCIIKGSLGMNILWNQNQGVNISQRRGCILEIDNRGCRLPIKNIVYEIKYNIRLQSDWNFHINFDVSVFKNILNVYIPAGEARMGENAIPLDLNFEAIQQNILNIHTTIGRLVECKFFVHVRPKMDGTCMVCCNQPKYNSYFVINPDLNLDVQPEIIQPPLNWSPSLLEHAKLLYNETYEVNREQDEREKKERMDQGNSKPSSEFNVLPEPKA